VSSNSQSPNLGEAATRFLVSLPPEKREASQQEVYKFVRWYGWERPFAELSAPDIANYAERLSLSDTDYAKKLELIRTFLIYAKKEGWSKSNLAIHLKAKKAKTSAQSSYHRDLPKAVSLTQQGYTELETELATLRDKRIKAIDEVRRAAADKDFRENAPLDAAREQRGQIEGQIRELEETLKSATIIDDKEGKEGKEREVTLTSNVGDRITLRDLASDEELCFRLVSPNEVDPTKGKISIASPIGKAVIGQSQGEIVGVTTPAGKLRYKIEQIEH
jgi:transcription elongation factor GreA